MFQVGAAGCAPAEGSGRTTFVLQKAVPGSKGGGSQNDDTGPTPLSEPEMHVGLEISNLGLRPSQVGPWACPPWHCSGLVHSRGSQSSAPSQAVSAEATNPPPLGDRGGRLCVSQGATVANGRSPAGELRQDRARAGSGDRPQEGMEHSGHQTDGPARVAGTMRGVGSPGRPLRCSQGTEPWASAEAPEGQQVASRGHV